MWFDGGAGRPADSDVSVGRVNAPRENAPRENAPRDDPASLDTGGAGHGVADPGALERGWIAGIQRGDVADFEAVVRAYGPPLTRFATGLLGARDAADDVVQDVLWRVWEGRAAWRPTVSLSAYLYAAVRNRALNALERDRVRVRYSGATREAAAHDPALYAAPSPAEVTEAAAEVSDRTAMVRRAFAALTERQQTAVRLRYEDGLSFADVAAALGVSVSAAEQLVARAIRVLRSEIVRP
jgi:RNA polymerase sigma-70 factor (ECF subfamily)